MDFLDYWRVAAVLFGILAVSSSYDTGEAKCGYQYGRPRHRRSSEPLIVGGGEATPHSWPWHAYMRFRNSQWCGGTIIKKRWIITAAHCFDKSKNPDDYTLTVGMHDINNKRERYQKEYQVQEIFIHSEYTDSKSEYGMSNDIALMYLKENITYNRYVQPICIGNDGSDPEVGENCVAIGYGDTSFGGASSDKLLEVNVPIVSNDQCAQSYKEKDSIYDTHICAGTTGKDTCQCDSGGPLLCENSNRWEIYGITSFGYGCGYPNKPGVYERVSSHYQWISDVMEGIENGYTEN